MIEQIWDFSPYNTIKDLCKSPHTGFDQKVEVWGGKGFKTMAIAVTLDNLTKWVGIAALTAPLWQIPRL